MKNSDDRTAVVFGGRLDEAAHVDPAGSYIGMTVTWHGNRGRELIVLDLAEAEALARTILAAVR